jgi:hypothetical protein
MDQVTDSYRKSDSSISTDWGSIKNSRAFKSNWIVTSLKDRDHFLFYFFEHSNLLLHCLFMVVVVQVICLLMLQVMVKLHKFS